MKQEILFQVLKQEWSSYFSDRLPSWLLILLEILDNQEMLPKQLQALPIRCMS